MGNTESLRPTLASSSEIPRGAMASLWRRTGSLLIDVALQAIPFLSIIFLIANLVMLRRGRTIGLKIVGARIMRENGDVSGFFHTFVRNAAALLSLLPLGLGYLWALWDDKKQTWHDKLMHTYVVSDAEGDFANREGTSSKAAVVTFWPILLLSIVFALAMVWLEAHA